MTTSLALRSIILSIALCLFHGTSDAFLAHQHPKSYNVVTPFQRHVPVRLNESPSSAATDSGDFEPTSSIEQELERLNEQLTLIEALEARNEAQLDSFVDKQDQWESMEDQEKDLLQSKDALLQRVELLTEQLVQLWMGQKSMEG